MVENVNERGGISEQQLITLQETVAAIRQAAEQEAYAVAWGTAIQEFLTPKKAG